MVKEEKWRRKRRRIEKKKKETLSQKKIRERKKCNSNLVGHQRNNQDRKKCRVSFWNKKYHVFMSCKKEYDVSYTFKTSSGFATAFAKPILTILQWLLSHTHVS